MRTFTSLVSESLGDDFAASKYGAQVGTWINDALRLLARRAHLPLADATATIALTAGQDTYDLPADFVRVLAVSRPDARRPLGEVDQAWIDSQDASSGVPDSYALYGQSVAVYPTPNADGDLQLRYLKSSADLAGAGQLAGVLPDEYGDLIVTYCRWHLFAREDDIEMAAYWKGEFYDGLARLRGDVQARGRRRKQVPGMYSRSAGPTFTRP